MKRSHLFSALALATVLVGAVACESESPTEALAPTPVFTISGSGSSSILSCSAVEEPDTTIRTVGSDGGTIEVGRHRLYIPAGALTSNVRITAREIAGPYREVDFQPQGLVFSRPVTLKLSYDGCDRPMALQKVVYLNETGGLVPQASFDDDSDEWVFASLQHFSQYAVAW